MADIPLTRTLVIWTRTVHVYLTMLGLILMMFFALSGFILNHAEWFRIDDCTVVETRVTVPPAIASDAAEDHNLRLVEYLRKHEGVRGEARVEDEPDLARVQFTAPGVKTEFTIFKEDGKTEVRKEIRGLLGWIGDLHTGKGGGRSLSLFIDTTAILLFVASVSGAILWISLPRRRVLGIIALVASVVLCAAGYFFLMP